MELSNKCEAALSSPLPELQCQECGSSSILTDAKLLIKDGVITFVEVTPDLNVWCAKCANKIQTA